MLVALHYNHRLILEMHLLRSIVIGFVTTIVISTSSAMAASSDWQDLGGGTVRMIASLDPATNVVHGAVEVKLEPGWTTYWRYPGGSGIPPQFNFSSSTSYQHRSVEFPGPKRIEYVYGAFAGYTDRVLFPFQGDFSGNLSGKINLRLLIGVCSDICIPAQAEMNIDARSLLQSDPVTSQMIAMSRLSVPVKKPAGSAVLNVEKSSDDILQITMAHQGSSIAPELFVEGPDDWYLKPAKLISQENDRAVFALDISRAPDDADTENQNLKFTLVTGTTGIETTR